MTDLAQRYGAPSRMRRGLLVAAVAVLAAAGLAWLVWAATYQSSPQVSSGQVSFTVDSEHAVSVRFDVVRKDNGVAATCALRALAEDHSVVGEAQVAVSSGPLEQTVAHTLRTDRRATSVEMLGCNAPGQPQRR